MLFTEEEILNFTADQILDLKSYTAIFENNEDQVKRLGRKLIMKWHSDRHPSATKEEKVKLDLVFMKIEGYMTAAQKDIDDGIWGDGKNRLVLNGTHSTVYFQYYVKESIPGLCDIYVGGKSTIVHYGYKLAPVTACWEESYRSLMDFFNKHESIKKNFGHWSKWKPQPIELADKTRYVRISTGEEFLCLRHILKKKPLPAVHVAWILTRLYNIACLLEISRVPNLDWSSKNIYVNPTTHEVRLLSGWEYTSHFDVEPAAVPAETARYCPEILKTKKFSPKHMLTLIKYLGKECLGDTIGNRLVLDKTIPAKLVAWLNSPAGNNSVDEYSKWEEVRDLSFGPRKFIKLDLKKEEVYRDL